MTGFLLLFLNVACFKKPDDTDNYYGNATSNKPTASSVLSPVLPFREAEFYMVWLNNNCIVFTIFSTKLYFQVSVIYSKRKVLLQNFTVHKLVLFAQSKNRCTCGNCQVLGRVEACICC